MEIEIHSYMIYITDLHSSAPRDYLSLSLDDSSLK